MIDKLWEIANSLRSVHPVDHESLDTLVGCMAMLISIATQLEQRKSAAEEHENNEEPEKRGEA